MTTIGTLRVIIVAPHQVCKSSICYKCPIFDKITNKPKKFKFRHKKKHVIKIQAKQISLDKVKAKNKK